MSAETSGVKGGVAMALIFIFLAVIFLSYANGANDNFKGVATLYGSRTTGYSYSLWLATISTLLGSLASIYFSLSLIKVFSGKGLVPDNIVVSNDFLLSVAGSAGFTVILASFLGFPISTTHSLTGALIGAGYMAVGSNIHFEMLTNTFILPLFLSPLIAILLSGALYMAFRFIRRFAKIGKEWCACVGEVECATPILQPNSLLAMERSKAISLSIDTIENCRDRYTGRVAGIEAEVLSRGLHTLSAASVSFARGLNDTPKIVALLMTVSILDIKYGIWIVAIAMGMGGLINARKVAQTMSKKITYLNQGQGLTANIATALLVLFASKFGMPVSTTHVSVGSLFGIGIMNRRVNLKIISEILAAWVLTLPIAALISGFIYFLC